MRAACVLLAAWALVAVHAQLPVGVTDDPCKSHAPTPDVSLGCIWGPLGDALEVPKCTQDGKHGLAKRLVEGVESIDAAHKAIHEGFATSTLSAPEFSECMEAAFAAEHQHAEPLIAKLKRAILSPKDSPLRNFTAVSAGSSVTAGHDNLYKQGWVFAFERAASCGFAAAGLNLIVRNAALGANQATQYSVCSPTVFGNDADLVMTEINSMMGCDSPVDPEVLVRNVYDPHQFPRRPFWMNVNGGGVSSGNIWGDITPECNPPRNKNLPCPNGHTKIMSNMCSDPKCKHIPCEEEKAADSKYTCAKLDKWISGYHVRFDKSDATLHDNYAAFGNAFYSPMGCIAKHAKQWEWTGSAMLRMGKQLNQGKGWHYGPYGHDLFGRLIAHWLLQQLKQALQEISTAVPAGIAASDMKGWADGYAAGLPEPPKELLDKVFCADDAPYCHQGAQCATTMEPHWTHTFTDQSGKVIVPDHKAQGEPETLMIDGEPHGVVVRPGSSDLNGWAVLLKESSAPLVDMRIACSQFSNCPAVLQNASDHHEYYDIGDVVHVLDSGHWAVTLTEQSLSRNEVLMGFNGGWGWKDRKYMLSGNNKSGTLELQLTSKQAYDGFMLCDGPFCNKAKEGQGCDHYRVPLAGGHLKLEMDGKDVTSKIHKKGDEGPLRRHMEGSFRPGKNGKEGLMQYPLCMWVAHPMTPGEHTLGLSVTSKEMVYVGHVIWW